MKPKADSWIYFIQTASGPIRIGVGQNVRARLSAMQAGSIELLTLLAIMPFDQDEEQRLYRAFSGLRKRGGWFRAGLDLVQFIEHVKATYPQELARPPRLDRSIAEKRKRFASDVRDVITIMFNERYGEKGAHQLARIAETTTRTAQSWLKGNRTLQVRHLLTIGRRDKVIGLGIVMLIDAIEICDRDGVDLHQAIGILAGARAAKSEESPSPSSSAGSEPRVAP